ncbi:putative nuclease domain-containing protein [Podospora conica]|nr:putative nuclease domain-containing protein [Schizothecium conicum]
MGWSFFSSSSSGGKDAEAAAADPRRRTTPPSKAESEYAYSDGQKRVRPIAGNESMNRTNWSEPRHWGPHVIVVSVAFGFWAFYRAYLRRFPGSGYIAPWYFHRRSLLGKVTSVGDGDGFHLFHTPGGRLAGWGWLRRVPTDRKILKGKTISVRIAGVDAPEAAHFGRPAQPFSGEALEFLKSYLLGKRVRAYVYKRDQYDRIVATAYVRKPPFFLRKDVGMELLKRGLATVYESKTGAEFGGPVLEAKYRRAEEIAKGKNVGMWAPGMKGILGLGKKPVPNFESPRAYKDRMRLQGLGQEQK